MCTASHNPKAYTGAKLVERGAIALSRRRGHRRHRAHARGRVSARRRAAGSAEEVDVYAEFQDAALEFIDPSAVRPLKVVLDGGNGMAGPDGRPDPRAARRPRARPDLLGARRRLPRPRAEPAAARRTASSSSQGARGGRRPRHRLGRRRRPLLLHRRDRASSSTATSSPRCSPSRSSQKHPGADILYDVRASRAVADTVEAAGGTRARQPRRPRLLQDPHARRGRRLRRRGLRPLLLRRLLQRRLGHDPGAADPRAARSRAQADRAARALPLQVLHLGRDQLRGRRPARRRCSSSRSATPTPSSASSTASRSTTTTGTSTCAPRTPSRCCG